MAFRITHDGQSWSSLDLKGREIEALEQKLGTDYAFIQPGRSMRHRLAILATFLSRKLPEDEVVEIIDGLTVGQLDDMFDWNATEDLPETYQDGHPLAAGSTSTGGSSGLPESTGGLPTLPEPNPSVT